MLTLARGNTVVSGANQITKIPTMLRKGNSSMNPATVWLGEGPYNLTHVISESPRSQKIQNRLDLLSCLDISLTI